VSGTKILEVTERITAFLVGKAEAWIVGGCVRDLLLGKDPCDLDLVVSGTEGLVRELALELKAALVLLSGPFAMYRLVLPRESGDFYVDIELVKDSDIIANLGRRDFTVDAMALPLTGQRIRMEELIDPWGGRADLQARVIRAVSPGVFKDDPVRALRAYRLAGDLGFAIDHATLCYLKTMKRKFETVAGERIWREFRAILALKRASGILKDMEDQASMLSSLIPELAPLKAVGRGRKHVLNAWDHTVLALEMLEEILEPREQGRFARASRLYRTAARGAAHDWTPALKLGMLLHDAGKPLVTGSRDEGPEFPGHEKAGLDIAKAVGERWRLPGWERMVVEHVVGGHMHPLYLYLDKESSLRARRRFAHKHGEYAPLILISSLADVSATRMAAGEESEREAYEEFVCDFLQFIITEGHEWQKLPRYIDGEKVMKILGIGPSPEVGRVLKLVAEKEIKGEITKEREAEDFVRMHYEKGSPV